MSQHIIKDSLLDDLMNIVWSGHRPEIKIESYDFTIIMVNNWVDPYLMHL